MCGRIAGAALQSGFVVVIALVSLGMSIQSPV